MTNLALSFGDYILWQPSHRVDENIECRQNVFLRSLDCRGVQAVLPTTYWRRLPSEIAGRTYPGQRASQK